MPSAAYSCGDPSGPPPNTESRSKAGVRSLASVAGSTGVGEVVRPVVEGDVVVDELADVGVAGVDVAVLLVVDLALGGDVGLLVGHDPVGQGVEVGVRPVRGRQAREHPAERRGHLAGTSVADLRRRSHWAGAGQGQHEAATRARRIATSFSRGSAPIRDGATCWHGVRMLRRGSLARTWHRPSDR